MSKPYGIKLRWKIAFSQNRELQDPGKRETKVKLMIDITVSIYITQLFKQLKKLVLTLVRPLEIDK